MFSLTDYQALLINALRIAIGISVEGFLGQNIIIIKILTKI